MSQTTHRLPMLAGGAIAAHRIVEVTGADKEAHQAAAANDALIGVHGRTPVAAGETAEVAIAGTAPVEAGAAVARGSLVTSDAEGKAIATVTAGHRVAGIALASAIAGDVFDILLSPGSV